MKNSCRRPVCRVLVTSGMQCDNCKGWFHEAFTDLTATADNRLSKSDHKWESVTCSTDAVVLLSNIIILLTSQQSKSSANVVTDSHKTGRQITVRNQNKNRDVDRPAIDGACIRTIDETLKLSNILMSTVPDSLSELGPHSSSSLNASVVPKYSVGDWTHVKKARTDQASPSTLNIIAVAWKSTGDLIAQSTPKNVRPVIKEPRIHKRASTSKQQAAESETTDKSGKT
ncbi:unnamed protein product [Schistosoma margrebowiei]|uniref:Uncharacterized protein n=1 Tax=Schistosoma margrebowiei TaxID=48269 RepID=A0A183M1I1_9TREM|nr:unnamed protein product [Schistosoma margrebowiei]